jgi:hypothetical protein
LQSLQAAAFGFAFACFLAPDFVPWGIVAYGLVFGLSIFEYLGRAFGLIPSGLFEAADLPPDPRKIQRSLQELLRTEWRLEGAIHFLHHAQGYEYSFLWPEVVSVTGLSAHEAMQLFATSCQALKQADKSEQIQVTTSVKP